MLKHIGVCNVNKPYVRLTFYGAKIYSGTEQRDQSQLCSNYSVFFSAIVIGRVVPAACKFLLHG